MQFAPKRPVKREPKSTDAEASRAPRGDEAGPSGGQEHDDPFAALMEQAKAVVKSERHNHGFRKNAKFNVAFGGGAQDGTCPSQSFCLL